MVATNSMLYGIAMESYSKNAHRGKSKLQTYLMDDPVIQTMEDLALLYTTPVFSFSLCRYTQPSLDTIVPPTAFHAATAVTTTNGYCNSKNSKRITHNDPAELRDDDEADHDDESISVSNTHPPDVPAFPTGMATKSSKAESSGIAVAKVAKKSSRRKFSKDRKRVSNISRSSEKTLKEAEIDWFQPGTCSKGVTARPAGRWVRSQLFHRQLTLSSLVSVHVEEMIDNIHC